MVASLSPGREFYETHSDSVRMFSGYAADPWENLSAEQRVKWEEFAAEVEEQDQTVTWQIT